MNTTAPPIAEKVKFWEEQDKINQAVIPRIIEMNDSLKALTTQMLGVDEKIASSEARVTSALRKHFDTYKHEQEAVLASISNIINQSITSTNDSLAALSNQVSSLDNKMEASEQRTNSALREIEAESRSEREKLLSLLESSEAITNSALREISEESRNERVKLMTSIEDVCNQTHAFRNEQAQCMQNLKIEFEEKLKSVVFPIRYRIAVLAGLLCSVTAILVSSLK